MRLLTMTAAVAVFLFSGDAVAAGTQASAPAKTGTRPALPQPRPVAPMPIGLTTSAQSLTPSQIAACANLAALRAMEARSAGSGFDAQRRILDVTFVLCVANNGAVQ